MAAEHSGSGPESNGASLDSTQASSADSLQTGTESQPRVGESMDEFVVRQRGMLETNRAAGEVVRQSAGIAAESAEGSDKPAQDTESWGMLAPDQQAEFANQPKVDKKSRVRAAREKISGIGKKNKIQPEGAGSVGSVSVSAAADAEKVTTETPAEANPLDLRHGEEGRIKNTDKSFEMARAEDAERTLARNLKAMGLEDVASNRVDQAKAAGEQAGKGYNEQLNASLNQVTKLISSGGGLATQRGKELTTHESYLKAVVGDKPKPFYEQTVGKRGQKVLEVYFKSQLDPNVVVMERRNAKTGELISVNTIAGGKEPLLEQKGKTPSTRYEVPGKTLKTLIKDDAIREVDLDHEADRIKSKEVHEVMDSGASTWTEHAMIQRGASREEVVQYRQKKKKTAAKRSFKGLLDLFRG